MKSPHHTPRMLDQARRDLTKAGLCSTTEANQLDDLTTMSVAGLLWLETSNMERLLDTEEEEEGE
jgi:hypothetical protein